MYIDSNGDAEGNFTVVALLDDFEMNGTLQMSMQPVGYFQYSVNGSNGPNDLPVNSTSNQNKFDMKSDTLQEFRYFNQSKPIQWVGGKLPSAEPKCGFTGEKCISKTDWRLIASISFFSSILIVAGIFALKYAPRSIIYETLSKAYTILDTTVMNRSSLVYYGRLI